MPPQNQQPNSQQPDTDQVPAKDQPSRLDKIRQLLLNPYLLGLLGLLLIGGGITWYAWQQQQNTITINGQDFETSSLSQADFAQLAAEQAEIDSTNKTLHVTANSIFNGTVLIKSSLDVQGQLRVGQELTLNDLAVAGQATINNLDLANDLVVQGETQLNGATTIQNNLSVAGALTVAGNGTFAGNLTADTINAGSLSFNGDLRMNGHIISSGPQTGASAGTAVGGGGTVSVSGNDVAGTVRVNTGGSPPAGILANVSFGRNYGQTPRVIVTPVGSATGSLDWYVIRTSNGFSIGTSSPPASGTNYQFDYFVIE